MRLREADLTGVRLKGGVLTGADLSGALLHKGDFRECDLRNSDLTALDPTDAQLGGAIIGVEQTIALAEAVGFDVSRAR